MFVVPRMTGEVDKEDEDDDKDEGDVEEEVVL